MRIVRYWLLAAVVVLAGCSSSGSVSVALPSTDRFVSLAENPAIKNEPGAEQFAAEISRYLDAGVRTVEARQYGPFPRQVIIYVPASIERFASFCLSARPVACVIGGHLFMSPKLMEQQHRIPAVLVHELSHLHLEQYAGGWNYRTRMPTWFTEGLAVFVSDGGGAEKVSRAEAIAAIRAGNAFVPSGSGSLLFQLNADDFGLTAHMFYRQAGMLVEWLYAQDAAHFEQMVRRLWSGNTLEQAMQGSYGFGVHIAWERFVNDINRQRIAGG